MRIKIKTANEVEKSCHTRWGAKCIRNKFFSLILALGSVISLCIFMQSCSEDIFTDNFTALTKEEKDLVSQFDAVGTKHNEVMGLVYNRLAEDLRNTNISPGEVFVKTFNNTKEFTHLSIASSSKFFPELKSSGSNINEMLIDDVMNTSLKLVVNENIIKLKSTSVNPDETIVNLINNKSQNFKTYIKALLTMIEKGYSIEQYNENVNSLIAKAFKNLDREEMEIFLCASSIAKHSFEYWHTNLQNWKNLLLNKKNINVPRLKSGSESNISPEFKKMLDDITKWDVAGGLGGAIGGTITGPGIIACALAGGATTSTTTAVVEIWDKYGQTFFQGLKDEVGNLFDW